MIDVAVYDRLSSDPALAALVADRIRPTIPTANVPQLPFLVYLIDRGGGLMSTGGPISLNADRLEVRTASHNRDDARAVLDAVRSLLHGWQDDTAGVQGCFLDPESEAIDPGEEDGYVGTQTYRLFWEAAG